MPDNSVDCEKQTENLQSPIKLLDIDQDDRINEEERKNNLGEMISYRQFSQLGYTTNTELNKGIQTDALSIGSFVELVYEELVCSKMLSEVLQNISVAYGYPRLKKYHKISCK